jgi:ectoine hydroxylase-related dioxygenase (phytanoyl-CoA dioxygenase family)
MSIDPIVDRIMHEGWCVIENVIPDGELPDIRDAVWGEIQRQRAEWDQEVARIVAAGHQRPPAKVAQAQALVNFVPQAATYIADSRILSACETLLGPRFRVSSVGAVSTVPGNERGYWHGDWPFNGTLAACFPTPFPDLVMNLSAIFILTPFSALTGGTIVIPGSHRRPDNPSTGNGIDRLTPDPEETNVEAAPGDVLLYDSRLWHAVGANRSDEPRTIMTVRYTPWWLNLEMRRPGGPEHAMLRAEANGKDNSVPLVPRSVFAHFDESARRLFAHWVENDEASGRRVET